MGEAPIQGMEEMEEMEKMEDLPHPHKATLSRCSLSPLVEVLGLEEFGFDS